MDKHDFLDLLADCDWKIEYDADTNSNGHMVDCSTFSIRGPLRALETFLEALGINRKHIDEALEDTIYRALEEPRPRESTDDQT